MRFLFFASLSESTERREISWKREYLSIREVQKQGSFPQQFEIVKTGTEEQLSYNVACSEEVKPRLSKLSLIPGLHFPYSSQKLTSFLSKPIKWIL